MRLMILLGLAACQAGPPAPPPPDTKLVAEDTFAGAAGTPLESRVTAYGWRRVAEGLVLTDSGTARPAEVSQEGAFYVSSWIPESPDYAVEARLIPKSLDGDGYQAGVVARVQAQHGIMLNMEVHDSTFRVVLVTVADTLREVATSWLRLELRPYTLRLLVRGDSATGLIDGVEQLRLYAPAVVAEGVVGIAAYQEDEPSDATGLQFDDFRVYAR